MRKLWSASVVITVFICLSSASVDGQSFKVFVYNPPLYQGMSDSAVDSSMQMFENFGTDWFLAHTSKTLYNAVKNTPMKVVSNNGQAHDYYGNRVDLYRSNVQLTSQRPFFLFDYIYFGAYLSTGLEADYKYGYRWERSPDSLCGENFNDQAIGRDVLKASVANGSTGYFFKSFNGELETPIDYGLNSAGYRHMTMKARMKIGDKNGSQSVVVARLIARNPWHNFAVSHDTIGEYFTEVINDSLFVYHGNGQTTTYIDTILPNQIVEAGQIYGNNVQPTSPYGDKLDTSKFKVCWYDTAAHQTICRTPSRYSKDIKVGDFSDASGYHEFAMPFVTHRVDGDGTYRLDSIFRLAYSIKWYDQKDIYLDTVWTYNDTGLILHQLAPSAIRSSLDSYCLYWAGQTGVPVDSLFAQYWNFGEENADVSLSSIGILKDAIRTASNSPKAAFGTFRTWQMSALKEDNQTRGIDVYKQYVSDSLVAVDPYPFDCETNYGLIDPSNSNSVLARINNILVESFDKVQRRIEEMASPKLRWFDVALTAGGWLQNTNECGVNGWKGSGLVPKEALAAELNLALCYNAKGFGYWYSAGQADPPNPTFNSFKNEDMRDDRVYLEPYSYEEIIPKNACCSTVAQGNLPNRIALIKLNEEGLPVPTDPDIWFKLDSINHFAKRNSNFFMNADWLDAGDESEVADLAGSTIDSVVPAELQEPAYCQISFWNYNSDKYFFIVNKRTRPNDVVDINLYFKHHAGLVELAETDGNSIDVDSVYDSLSVCTRKTITLSPGGAKLFRVRETEFFKGNWSGTWPQFSTIKITGDVTVPSGQTLSIQTGGVTFRANTDSLHTGNDTQKSELIVNGTLRLQGASVFDPVILTSHDGSEQSWYGVRTVSGGKIVAQYAQFKHGYSGVRILDTSPDSITNCVFQDCYMYGLYNSGNNNLVFRSNWVGLSSISPQQHQGSGYYANSLSSSTHIAQSTFQNVKYGVLCHGSNVRIDTCTFSATARYTNHAGVLCEAISVPQVLKCDFDNYDYGVITGYKSSGTLISYCHFHSTLTEYTTGRGRPCMFRGVLTDDVQSDCKVRHCCFEEIAINATENEYSNIDLGTTTDAGDNKFRISKFRTQPDSTKWGYFPSYAIYNLGETQLQARGNHFQPRDSSVQNRVLYADTIYSDSITGSCGAVQPKMNVFEPDQSPLPASFAVSQNYPNPFNATTEISFTLPAATYVTIDIFNVIGQRVTRVADGDFSVGSHVVTWTGTGDGGREVSSGVYFYRVLAGDQATTKKMLLLK